MAKSPITKKPCPPPNEVQNETEERKEIDEDDSEVQKDSDVDEVWDDDDGYPD